MIEICIQVKYPEWVRRLMDVATDDDAPQVVREQVIALLFQHGYALLRFGNETRWEHQLKFDERLED